MKIAKLFAGCKNPPTSAMSPFIFVYRYVVLCTFDLESYMQRKNLNRLGMAVVVMVIVGASFLSIRLIAQARQDQRIPISARLFH